MSLEILRWRTIQIGLGGEAVDRYLAEWIVRIEDVTSCVKDIRRALDEGDRERALRGVPTESPYPLSRELAERIGANG